MNTKHIGYVKIVSLLTALFAVGGCAELSRQGMLMMDNRLSEPYEKPQIIVHAVPKMMSFANYADFRNWSSSVDLSRNGLIGLELDYPKHWRNESLSKWLKVIEKGGLSKSKVKLGAQQRNDVLVTFYSAKASVLGCDSSASPGIADSKTGFSKQLGCSDVKNLVAMTPNPLTLLEESQYLPGVSVIPVNAVLRFNTGQVIPPVSPEISAGSDQ
ncbi:hypothetical protein [Vibrio nigripulchritudo]|uniref:hypothetical protein n=1 Tax=Vibrio nigripulchritudo TaxID=28173 RepID=UPI0005F9EF32|nr:hypothetical protein [Vibrio nigripulchritudo]KJY80958.1 hypothetical protein TW74_01265 [Vibrio nigripulchritudo]